MGDVLNMDNKVIEAKAKELQSRLGGTIFAFPIDENDPFSEYAALVYATGKFHIYPKAENVNIAAIGVTTILEEMKKHRYATDYEHDVRFVSYEVQINAPSVTIRRLKKQGGFQSTLTGPAMQSKFDVMERDDGEKGYLFSARGVIKYSYMAMVDDNTPKAAQFMEEYYKVLAMRKYGKTVAAIKREVMRMDKDEAIDWIEMTYDKYVHDSMEIMNIFNRLSRT